MIAAAAPVVLRSASRAIAPRARMLASDWADKHFVLTSKGSGITGPWQTSRNPMLREILEACSLRSGVHEVFAKLPIQSGKTMLAVIIAGYYMDQRPCPIMCCLPGEVAQKKWINQKLGPALESVAPMRAALTSVASRDAANQRDFKDFLGGQLHIEHAGSPGRLKTTSAQVLIVDEYTDFAVSLRSGDDPGEMLTGRLSAFPSNYLDLRIGTPGIEGLCRMQEGYDNSDQRRYHVPCPHCGETQELVLEGMRWNPEVTEAWYQCAHCEARIDEHHKTQMIAWGRWVPTYPERTTRGYTYECWYYGFGLGPRWLKLVKMWLAAQGDVAKLKTYLNDRLARSYQDRRMAKVKGAIIAQRAEPRPLRPLPAWVLAVTVGIDTQDNRLAVQIVGWGRGMTCWPIDYVELPGDPNGDDVWVALVDLLNRPIPHALGGQMRPDAFAQDTAGHRTEAVKAFARKRLLRRFLPIHGAKASNAPVLKRGQMVDINWKGQLDKKSIQLHAVGTVNIKHVLFGQLSLDADADPEARRIRFSDQLPDEYFDGLVSEIFDPSSNTYKKRKGAARNEPLDTWVYAYAATHHPELRLHRWTKADWDRREAALRVGPQAEQPAEATAPAAQRAPTAPEVERAQPTAQAPAERPRTAHTEAVRVAQAAPRRPGRRMRSRGIG